MKFGHLLEYHKIPEWYTQYCAYNEHQKRIKKFKDTNKKACVQKLKGYYTINQKGRIYCLDVIGNSKKTRSTRRKLSYIAEESELPQDGEESVEEIDSFDEDIDVIEDSNKEQSSGGYPEGSIEIESVDAMPFSEEKK